MQSARSADSGKQILVRRYPCALWPAWAGVAIVPRIQFRLLNRSKGPAVRGPRAQADRKLYRVAMQEEIRKQIICVSLKRPYADLYSIRIALLALRPKPAKH